MKTIKHNFKPGAEYAPASFDEKNFTTDWLEEFLFDNCVHSTSENAIIGFATFNDDDDAPMQVGYCSNAACWKFLSYNYIDDTDVEWFFDALDKYLSDNSDGCTEYAYICTLHERVGFDDYNPEIHVRFFAKI